MAAADAQKAGASGEAAKIANGHAFAKHSSEFGEGLDRAGFRAMIEETLTDPAAVRDLANDRTAYWSESLGMVVIVSPNDIDFGTAFRPVGGREYFENLK